MANHNSGPYFSVPQNPSWDPKVESRRLAISIREDILIDGPLETLLLEQIVDAFEELRSNEVYHDISTKRKAERRLTRSIHALLDVRRLRLDDSLSRSLIQERNVEPVRWRDRLSWESTISEDSPTIRGTWITVSQVVSQIVDGWSWSDLLRAHPELCEDDLRACLAYTTEEDRLG